MICSALLSASSPQATLLNSFPDIFDELLQMFTVQEVAEYVRGTLGSMPSTVDIGQSMDVVKLQSIARTVESRLFFFPGRCLLCLEPHVRGASSSPCPLLRSSVRVPKHFAAGGSASHPPTPAPAEGAAHLLWDSRQHLFHN